MSRSQSTRQAFTLFEVAISLVLVTFGVTSVLMLLPSGLKAQHHARYQIHAAVIMQNIARHMAAPAQQHFNLSVEAEKLSNNIYLNRAMASLENIADGSNLGLAPLPVELCLRFDSDNDEINRIISEGGRIYYNLPGGPPQALIMGFVGAPQQNALPNHPCLSWPYWDQHPCGVSAWERTNWGLNPSWPGKMQLDALYAVFNSTTTPAATTVTLAKWQAYRDAAKALVEAVVAEPNSGLTTTVMAGGLVLNPPTPYPTPTTPDGPWPIADEAERRNIFPKPYVVWAASHLAHAAAYGTGRVQDRPATTPPTADQVAYARACFESCRQWVQRASRADPYDWGVARQTAQQTAWDFPLVHHDVFDTTTFPSYEDSS